MIMEYQKITEVSKNSQQNNSQRELQMKMIKKYLNKDIYLQTKDRKLLMILIVI